MENKTKPIDVQVNNARREIIERNRVRLCIIVDTIMDELFKDCLSNQTYLSKTKQNEILEICDEIIAEILVGEVKQAKFFSVLSDEATDCSNVEQMAVVPTICG
jgi:hypothetical protein